MLTHKRKRSRDGAPKLGASAPPAAGPSSAAKGPSNLLLRLATAAVGIPVILSLLFVIPRPGWFVLVAAAIAAGAGEALAMTLPGERDKIWIGVPISLALSVLLYAAPSAMAVTAGVLGLVLVSLLVFLFRPGELTTTARRLAFFVFSIAYPTLLLAPVGLIHRRQDGAWWVVLTLAVTWLADTGGYFAGRAFGRHKLMPSVSPAKTVEGAVGAVLAAVLGALVVVGFFLPRVALWQAAALGAVTGALNILGDLCESLLKRSVGVKDSGTLLPGHGGMLDRVDALMFTAPAVWLFADLVVTG